VRIRRLTLAGFGPYKNEQVVDFSHFDDAGLFLITGKTGAGKSSILDAICFALYGSVPRYDGTQAQLRSDHCDDDDPTFVELEFTVGGIDYSVRRVPEYLRPKKKRAGTTKQAHEASLSRNGEVLAAKPVDVAHDLAEIVSLTKDQFLQVVLLAQNRFQQFLLAKNDDRQSVLRTLFGSKRFEQIEVSLDDRRKVLQAELAGADDILTQHVAQAARLLELDEVPDHPGQDWFDDGRAGLAAQHVDSERAAAVADVAFSAADIEHRTLLDTRALQSRRALATAAIATLDDDAATVTSDRATLDSARRAAPVWPLLSGVTAAARAVDDATAVAAAARAVYEPFDDATPVAEVVDTLASTLGTLADVLVDERTLPALDADLDRLAAEAQAAEAALAETLALAGTLPDELDTLASRVTQASVRAAGGDPAAEALARATRARAAARSAAEARTRLELADVAERQASAAHTAAAVELDSMLERRLSGYAAELALELVDGDPCAVCGSTGHPSPAVLGDAPVTAADIESARDAVTRLRAEMDAAHATAAATSAELADALARAGDSTTQELEAAVAEAEGSLTLAREAATELAALEKERDHLRATIAQIEPRIDSLRSAKDACARGLAETRSRRTGIAERIAKHRADSASVSERVSAIEARLGAARALINAEAAVTSSASTLAATESALSAELAEQNFVDADEARAARRTAEQIAAIEQRLRLHDEARATAQATLSDPDIASAPNDLVDVEPARLARAAALDERDAAIARSSALGQRLGQLDSVVRAARDHRESTGQRRVEFEQLRQLASVVRGDEPNTRRMRLETFVLAAQLEEIVAAANSRLRTMSAGRYALEHDDAVQYRNAKSGLGLAIRDEHTGRTRPTHSLSGGETFLASLALALGLAEVVTNQAGGITLDTLFIDEGFGSLDGDTLEIAMSTLDGLREGGRTIGLISHVEAMKEQIPAKLRITVSARGDSSVEETYEPE